MDCFEVGNKKIVALILVLLLVFSGGMVFNQILASPGASDEVLIEPDSYVTESSYVVFKDGSDFKMRNGTSGEIDWDSTDDDAIIQKSIDNATVSGGSVYVKSAVYSASVTLKDNVTLWFERGVSGITVTVDSGADCTLIDEENGFRKEYVSGVLYSFMDYRSGEFWYGGENRTDLILNPMDTATFIVESDGTTAKWKNCSSGQIVASGTNQSQITNWALGNLTSGRTWQEKVVLKGNFTIDSTLKVYSWTDLEIIGQITASVGFSGNMIENGNPSGPDYMVDIHGTGIIDGNAYNADDGLHWNNTATPPSAHRRTLKLYGLKFRDFADDGVYISETHNSIGHLYDLCLEAQGGYSLNGVALSDWFFDNLQIGDAYLDTCDISIWSNVYSEGQIIFNWASGIKVSNWHFDVGSIGEHGLTLLGIQRSQFDTCDFRLIGDGQTDKDAVYLQTVSTRHCSNNSFTNIYVGSWGGDAGTSRWRYGVNEADNNQTDNLYSGINCVDTVSGMLIQGTNSEVEGCLGFVTENCGTVSNAINGTWVPHGCAGTPDVVSLTISGSNYINSTCFLLQPTVIASNSTMFQIGFYFYMNATAIYPVTTVEQRDVYWSSEYKP